jgi:hypothetical protein
MINQTIKREEFKYYIHDLDAKIVSETLQKILMLDKNANPITREYTVSSLYFDTFDSQDLNEKLDGILERKKYRMRIYNNNLDTIKFETKKRVGTFISKDSERLSLKSAERIIANCFDKESKISVNFASVLSSLNLKAYRSRVIVEYDREAYYLPLDKNLRTYNTHKDLLFLDDKPTVPVFLDNNQILEIKFENSLPNFIKNILSNFSLYRCSISKYVLAQRYTDSSARRDHLINPY